MDNLTCKNCGIELSGAFCRQCGQKKISSRLNFKDIWNDFAANVLDVEAPIINNIKGLTLYPGRFIKDFINGKRKSKYKPVQYYILIMGIYFLLYYGIGIDALTQQEVNQARGTDYQFYPLVDRFDKILNENIRLFSILLVPILGFMTRIFFKKSSFNYIENLTLALYLSAHAQFISIAFCFIYLFHYPFYSTTGLLILLATGYICWGIVQFFDARSFGGIVKGVLCYFFSYVIFICISSILIFSYLFIVG
ncbi:MAG: hypothetical protein COA57_05945 [Flavobacteriales bacterium]|nr:MAG: hypothetical protein COA57_05945 [Flavobacteriales bacterium]